MSDVEPAENYTRLGWMQVGALRRAVEIAGKLLRLVRIHGKHKELRICETLALGEQRSLLLVEWKHEQLLIGVARGNITLLKTQPEPAREVAKRGSEP